MLCRGCCWLCKACCCCCCCAKPVAGCAKPAAGCVKHADAVQSLMLLCNDCCCCAKPAAAVQSLLMLCKACYCCAKPTAANAAVQRLLQAVQRLDLMLARITSSKFRQFGLLMQRNIDVTFPFISYSFFQSLQDHKVPKDRRGCIALV